MPALLTREKIRAILYGWRGREELTVDLVLGERAHAIALALRFSTSLSHFGAGEADPLNENETHSENDSHLPPNWVISIWLPIGRSAPPRFRGALLAIFRSLCQVRSVGYLLLSPIAHLVLARRLAWRRSLGG